jgi:pyruvate kinase
MGIYAKIETRAALRNLAHILIAGLELPAFAVMIARGDLAVEVGFEELPFVQEDILSMCEAAHLPVIWATQVLETLTQQGLPDRAELTDAVHGQRADCVMLNKGAHIARAVCVLSDLLAAESQRHVKKRDVFRTFIHQEGVFEPAPSD